MDILPGMDFARSFHILEELGKGRLGTVYRAFDAEHARYVALRVLPPGFTIRPGLRERFESLAANWAALHHPHIQEVYSYGQADDLLFLAGEFIEGGSLEAHVGTPISMSFTIRALSPIAGALDFAHAQGMLHRDVKPANIMLSREGRPVLVDFGLVDLLESAARQSTIQTGAGTFASTPAYMAPELVTHSQVGAAADRYALGIIAYQMLTGRLPFTGDTPMAVLLAQASTPPVPASSVNAAIPAAVSDVLQTALAKDPVQRYPTAGVFIAELEEAGRSMAAAQPVEASAVGISTGGSGAAAAQDGGSGSRMRKPPPRQRSDGGGRARGEGALPDQFDAVRTRVALSLSKGLARLRTRVPIPALIGILVVVIALAALGVKSLAGPASPQAATVTPTAQPASTATSAPAQATSTAGSQATAGASATGAPSSQAGSGTWAAAATLNIARAAQQAVTLKDGRVLVIGGSHNQSPSSDAEIFDPASGKWTKTGSMNDPRGHFAATVLADGRVLVAGGTGGESDLASAELYDPKSGAWTPTGSLAVPREQHTATLLNNGDVLVAGGIDSNATPLGSAELYDPATGKWTTTKPMHNAHWDHTATLLRSGKVLITGGGGTSAELFDPAAGTWTSTGNMAEKRYWHTATLLKDGRVLVVGGEATFGRLVQSAEIYDPQAGKWSPAASPSVAHDRHTATLLPNGNVLILGGNTGTDADVSSESGIATAERYDPATNSWSSAGSMTVPRAEHTSSLLGDGKVLVAGGFTAQGMETNSTEIYTP